jgi:heme/copper-type cytochrome/quinol oxidase subunit 2
VEGISERNCKSSEDEVSIFSEDEEDAVAADSGIALCTGLFFFIFFFVFGAFAASWWKIREGVVPGAEGGVATKQG